MTDTAKLQIYREFFDASYAPYASANPPDLPIASLNSTSNKATKTIPTLALSSIDLESAKPYILLIAINSIHVNLNPVRLQLSLFDQSHFPQLKLKHQARMLENSTLLVSVETFSNLDQAMSYYSRFMAEKTENIPLQPSQYQVLLISSNNYNKLHSLSDLEVFNQFFNTQIKPKAGAKP